MKLKYDVEVDILYFDLEREDAEVEDTLEFADGVFLDVDENGNALGIEFISQDAFSGFVEEHGLSLEILSWIHGGSLHRTLDVASRKLSKVLDGGTYSIAFLGERVEGRSRRRVQELE